MRIIKGKIPGAKKIAVYGPEGIGKSTFAAQFPDPVFIDTEGSTKDMDVARFEKASSWPMLQDQVRYVIKKPDTCKTLVIDTMDWAEQSCMNDLCARNGKKGIEDFGYGNGYVYAKEEFGRFLNLLEEATEKGVHVVVTAHAHIKRFDQPDEMGSYDRWELKLGKKTGSQTAPLLKEWADMVLFCNYKTLVVNVDGQGAQKGKNKAQGGRRVMYTSHHTCWDAKNRYGLPEELPFEYAAIAHVINGSSSQPMRAETGTPAPEPPTRPATQTQAEPAKEQPQSAPGPEKKVEAAPPAEQFREIGIDERIPKNLRDLMRANNVCEWDIQAVCEAKGYVPGGTPVYQYETVNPGFIDGVLVGAWDQVYEKIMEMKKQDALVFN